MNRRNTTLLACFLIVAIGLAVALRLPVNYVALGPTVPDDTLGAKAGTQIIKIDGATTYPTTGKLFLTTVSVSTKLTMGEAITRWVQGDYAVIPYDVVFPPTQTTAQTDAQNAQDMVQSEDDATTAALDYLHRPLSVAIDSFSSGSKAKGPLQTGDTVVSIDGKAITSALQLAGVITTRKPGDVVTVTYRRSGTAGTAQVPLIDDGNGHALLGIIPAFTSPGISIDITNKGVGGPSAGLMYALGIIDKLSPPAQQVTGGKVIAGTGEIDRLGRVSDIGGIQQKLIGAHRNGATVFLVPAGNCAEAVRAHVGGLTLLKIPDGTAVGASSGLAVAHQDLLDLVHGGPAPATC